MATASKNKLRLLNLIEIFKTETDDEHLLSASQLISKLESRGYSVDRKSIYDDIQTLKDYGYDIILAHSPRKGYFLAEREFELAEVRLLTDAVQSANFISEKKSKNLIEKIEKFVSSYQADIIRSQIYMESRPKTRNEQIYYNIDKINTAIKKGKQIQFKYKRRKIGEKYTTVTEEKDFCVNPYAMIWSNDHYYLISNNPKYDNLMHTRIDKMISVEILDTPARHFSEVSEYSDAFDSADYTKKHFNMFSGETQTTELLCDNSIFEQIIDYFGDSTVIRSEKQDTFTIKVQIAASDGFISWLMQFGDKIYVKSPHELRIKLKQKCRDIINLYENQE